MVPSCDKERRERKNSEKLFSKEKIMKWVQKNLLFCHVVLIKHFLRCKTETRKAAETETFPRLHRIQSGEEKSNKLDNWINNLTAYCACHRGKVLLVCRELHKKIREILSWFSKENSNSWTFFSFVFAFVKSSNEN